MCADVNSPTVDDPVSHGADRIDSNSASITEFITFSGVSASAQPEKVASHEDLVAPAVISSASHEASLSSASHEASLSSASHEASLSSASHEASLSSASHEESIAQTVDDPVSLCADRIDSNSAITMPNSTTFSGVCASAQPEKVADNHEDILHESFSQCLDDDAVSYSPPSIGQVSYRPYHDFDNSAEQYLNRSLIDSILTFFLKKPVISIVKNKKGSFPSPRKFLTQTRREIEAELLLSDFFKNPKPAEQHFGEINAIFKDENPSTARWNRTRSNFMLLLQNEERNKISETLNRIVTQIDRGTKIGNIAEIPSVLDVVLISTGRKVFHGIISKACSSFMNIWFSKEMLQEVRACNWLHLKRLESVEFKQLYFSWNCTMNAFGSDDALHPQWRKFLCTGERSFNEDDGNNNVFNMNTVRERLQNFPHILNNKAQMETLMKILSMPPGEIFTLIGPPGTGKTELISVLTWLLNSFGKRTHTVSKTNLGAATILEKSMNHGLDQLILRYGHPQNEKITAVDLRVSNFATFKVYLPLQQSGRLNLKRGNPHFKHKGECVVFRNDFLDQFNIQSAAKNRKFFQKHNFWMANSLVLYIRYDWFGDGVTMTRHGPEHYMNFRILNQAKKTSLPIDESGLKRDNAFRHYMKLLHNFLLENHFSIN
ncbi:hypothetical protein RCL1_001645 [Eukaryota sp. TZLM3-RCL]